MSFALNTDAIDEKGFFDPRYTCDIDNSSPELRWQGEPEGTAGFALIAESMDISQGGFVHWVVYNIPNDVHHLPTGIPPQDALPNGIRQGLNGYNKLGYSGPCPPKNSRPQRYLIRLFALKELPDPPVRAKADQLLKLIDGLVLATADITGLYQRVMIERAG